MRSRKVIGIIREVTRETLRVSLPPTPPVIVTEVVRNPYRLLYKFLFIYNAGLQPVKPGVVLNNDPFEENKILFFTIDSYFHLNCFPKC